MTKQEADDIFDSKGDEALDKLLDYILVEGDYDKATKFIMEIVGCDETVAREMAQDISPHGAGHSPVKQANIPHCPTCGSTNIEKITATSKAVNTIVFGIFGTKRHKSFHCNNCKYEW